MQLLGVAQNSLVVPRNACYFLEFLGTPRLPGVLWKSLTCCQDLPEIFCFSLNFAESLRKSLNFPSTDLDSADFPGDPRSFLEFLSLCSMFCSEPMFDLFGVLFAVNLFCSMICSNSMFVGRCVRSDLFCSVFCSLLLVLFDDLFASARFVGRCVRSHLFCSMVFQHAIGICCCALRYRVMFFQAWRYVRCFVRNFCYVRCFVRPEKKTFCSMFGKRVNDCSTCSCSCSVNKMFCSKPIFFQRLFDVR